MANNCADGTSLDGGLPGITQKIISLWGKLLYLDLDHDQLYLIRIAMVIK